MLNGLVAFPWAMFILGKTKQNNYIWVYINCKFELNSNVQAKLNKLCFKSKHFI